MALRRSRGGSNEPRPFVFPSLKVDGELWTQEVVIPNRGQGVMAAQQEAAQLIRQQRAAKAAAEAKAADVPNDGDMVDETSRNEEVLGAIRSDMESQPAVDVEGPIREWLAAHLPSTEQLFAASASLVGLQGIDARVRDLVASFQEGLDSYRAAFTSWFEGVQQNWAEMVANGEATLQQWSDQIAEVSRWRDDLEQRLFAAIADKRGPKGDLGNTGMAGAATTVVDRLPKGKGPDFLVPYIGRSAVVGDIAIDASTDARFAWRWDGQSWERGPSMTSIQVRDVRVNSVQGAPQYTTQVIQRSGGGAGGGERLLNSGLTQVGASLNVGNSSNWPYVAPDNIRGGFISLTVTATSGPLAGKSSKCLLSFVVEPLGESYSEFALDGSLASAYSVSLTATLQAGTAAAGFTGTYPTGVTACLVWLQVQLVPGGGGSNGDGMLLQGEVFWDHPAVVGQISATGAGAVKPLWVWI